MTKKDYVLIADAIKNWNAGWWVKNNQEAEELRNDIAEMIGSALEKDNFRFDWDKWSNYITSGKL
jgi:hypothetical protein